MGKALYRTYRSRNLSEIVGQDHITTTLQNALKSGRIAHAYLLTGPRGVGKTSVARILAHEVNGLEYSEDPHFDIIEIDAASNNGVEDVRELRDNIMSAPASAKYKVFIIDEVHMLSKAAFNALLKTLEEPPAHVIFILATTEAHKLPETIVSRTQRYSFRPVSIDAVVSHLKSIAKKERITIDDDALTLIAAHGDGSFRDSISLLDQASSISEHITSSDVEQLLGHAPGEQIEQLLERITEQDITASLGVLSNLFEHGYEPAMVASQLSKTIRGRLTTGSPELRMAPDAMLALLRDLLDIPPSHSPQVLFEIVVMKACGVAAHTTPRPAAVPKPTQSQAQPSAITNEKTSVHAASSAAEGTPAPTARSRVAPDTNKQVAEQISAAAETVETEPSVTIGTLSERRYRQLGLLVCHFFTGPGLCCPFRESR